MTLCDRLSWRVWLIVALKARKGESAGEGELIRVDEGETPGVEHCCCRRLLQRVRHNHSHSRGQRRKRLDTGPRSSTLLFLIAEEITELGMEITRLLHRIHNSSLHYRPPFCTFRQEGEAQRARMAMPVRWYVPRMRRFCLNLWHTFPPRP